MAWTITEITEFERLIKVKNKHFERFRESSLHALIALLKKTPAPSKAIAAAVSDLVDHG